MNGTSLALFLAFLGPAAAAFANELDAKVFHEFDRDQDEVVTYFEFAHRMKEEFLLIDRSQDRLLTQQEHSEFHLTQDQLDPFALTDFEHLDRDRDKLVTLGEFAYAVGVAFAVADGAVNGERDERVTLSEYLLALDRAKITAAHLDIFQKQVVQSEERKAGTR